jgi:hypothetical protein
MSFLVSKTNTYNDTAFEKPYWKTDVRLGFDPPEDAEGQRREKEWMKQFQRQRQQMKVDWENYEKESANAVPLASPKPKEKDEKEREDKKKFGLGLLSSAMKPNFKKLVRHGIPSELRANIWFEKSGASRKKHDNPGVYAKYVAQIDMDSTVMEEIQMDMARTFTMHLMFCNHNTKRMMLRILNAFTIRNPNYGYCQNMTFIVAIILFFLPEEDAFWLFTTILEDILFVDFCSPSMIGLRVDQKVLETLIKERLSKLYAHFARHSIDVSVFTTSWLLRLFVNVFPIETTLRVWDCFLFEGSKILFRVALAYLKLHDEQLKICTDSGEVMTFLSTECKMCYDADRLIKACASFWALRRKQINELRARYTKELADPSQLTDSDNINHPSSNFTTSELNGSETSAEENGPENWKKGGHESQKEDNKTRNYINNNEQETSTTPNASMTVANSNKNNRDNNIFNNEFYNDDEYDLC